MTDPSTSNNSHTASLVDSLPGTVNTGSRSVDAPRSAVIIGDDDEPYTIKCICAFQDDDGHTAFCDRCDTWQHVTCYYPDGVVPEVHACADCEPRSLDARAATERQREKREALDDGEPEPEPELEPKTKKQAGKSHKKKIKITDSNVNDCNYDIHESSAHDSANKRTRDQAPLAKRPKTTHRTSASTSTQPGAPLLGKRSGSSTHHLRSPMKTPTSQSPSAYYNEPYSPEYLQLYDHDPGDVPMQTNLLNDIGITNSLSQWSEDVEELAQATNGKMPEDVFKQFDRSLDSYPFPELRLQITEEPSVKHPGTFIKRKSLHVDSFIPCESLVGELKGKIGHMREYTQDPANRWQYLRHPVPFVFFHPALPIYIDTRTEGTRCRYVRRSCDPNLRMITFLENGSDYHFCLVAIKDIEPGNEVTIGWVLDEYVRKYLDRFHFRQHEYKDLEQGTRETNEAYVSDWVEKVLPDFGGCACYSSDPDHCALARYARRGISTTVEATTHMSNGKPMKGKKHKNVNSPQMSCKTSISRDPSEGLVKNEDQGQDEYRSNTTSSKSDSREPTPTDKVSFHNRMTSTEISARDKRKIAAVEKSFEQLEQDRNTAPVKKKQRTSGGSTFSSPAVSAPVCLDGHLVSNQDSANITRQKYLSHPATLAPDFTTPDRTSKLVCRDASTSPWKSGSPAAQYTQQHTVHSVKMEGLEKFPCDNPNISSMKRSNYVDASTQTDKDEDDDFYHSPTLRIAKMPYVSLSQQLLRRAHADRARLEEHLKAVTLTRSSPANQEPSLHSLADMQNQDNNVPNMTDAPEICEDTEMEDKRPDESLRSSEPILMRSPVEKHQPSDDDHPVHFNHDIPSKVKPPPPPWPANPSHLSNGYRSVELRVQLPPTPQFTSTTSDTPTSGTPNSFSGSCPPTVMMRTPNTYPPSSLNSAFVQPSPVKKKLSLGDYMRRSNSKPETHIPPPDKAQSSGLDTASNAIPQPLTSPAEQAETQEVSGSLTAQTPENEDRALMVDTKDPKL